MDVLLVAEPDRLGVYVMLSDLVGVPVADDVFDATAVRDDVRVALAVRVSDAVAVRLRLFVDAAVAVRVADTVRDSVRVVVAVRVSDGAGVPVRLALGVVDGENLHAWPAVALPSQVSGAAVATTPPTDTVTTPPSLYRASACDSDTVTRTRSPGAAPTTRDDPSGKDSVATTGVLTATPPHPGVKPCDTVTSSVLVVRCSSATTTPAGSVKGDSVGRAAVK